MTKEEAITKYREMDKNDEFLRKIISVKPIELKEDEVVLECTHIFKLPYDLIASLAKTYEGKVPCTHCENQWLKEHNLREE